MNELYILRCHLYYSQYLTVACVEFQTFKIPLKFLLFLTANFCYNWSTEYLLEITISQGYICKRSLSTQRGNPILWVFSQHFKIENYNFSDMYGYILEIAALWKFTNHVSIKWCKTFVKVLFQETTLIPIDQIKKAQF